MEPNETPSSRPDINWFAVASGAAVGLGVVVVAAVLHAILDHNVDDLDDSGWVYPLFVLVLLGYGSAGWVGQWTAASRGSSDAPLTHGALAGIGVLVIWFPIRALIWVARDESRGLFSGDDAALRPGQIFGHIVIATGLAMLGAYVAARAIRRRDDAPRAHG